MEQGLTRGKIWGAHHVGPDSDGDQDQAANYSDSNAAIRYLVLRVEMSGDRSHVVLRAHTGNHFLGSVPALEARSLLILRIRKRRLAEANVPGTIAALPLHTGNSPHARSVFSASRSARSGRRAPSPHLLALVEAVSISKKEEPDVL